ncbi:hypothetical protein HBI10_192570 [Parastagonospora nodorum]|nr:hypothetical protein HBI10_192570 [Parastagonospora nodorum]
MAAKHCRRVTKVPPYVLRNAPLDEFSVNERMSWAECRETKYGEDKAYTLLGLFGISMLPNYSEGVDRAFTRFQREIQDMPDVERQGFLLHKVSLSILGTEVIKSLVRSSSRLFIWAATAYRFISKGLYAAERLQILSNGSDHDSVASP